MTEETVPDDAPVLLRVEVPFCSFRPDASREYQDTHPVPPPATVYGMLLSLVGVPRERKGDHRGVRLALALEGEPERARVFRKLRRGKELVDLRPDYQDLLCGLTLWAYLETGDDPAPRPLTTQVRDALYRPHSIRRSGGLSLGESSFLVDSVSDRTTPPGRLTLVRPDPAGFHSLPVWVDHMDRRNTVQSRFLIEEGAATDLPGCAVTIGGAA